jgi:hypothetical protein
MDELRLECSVDPDDCLHVGVSDQVPNGLFLEKR